MCHNARGHLKRTCKFWQCDVPILCHQFFEKGLMGGKLTMGIAKLFELFA